MSIRCCGYALFGLASLGFCPTVRAAETVVLNYAGQELAVPLTDIQTFAETGKLSPEMEAYIQGIPPTIELTRSLLTDEIPVRFNFLEGDETSAANQQFVLLQINEMIGDLSSEGDLDALRTALVASTADDQDFSILHLLEAYPEPVIQINLATLGQVYNDATVFLERLQPLLASRGFIEDWLCECEPGTSREATPQVVARSSVPCSVATEKQEWVSIAQLISSTNAFPLELAQANSDNPLDTPAPPLSLPPVQTGKQLVISYGPLGRSIAIDELTAFAETGEPTRQLRFYLGLAKVQPEAFRALLTRHVAVNFRTLDRWLNNLLGEYLLFRAGNVVHTRSKQANIQALRSALVVSASNDNHISLLEVLQNFPTSEIHLNLVDLARTARVAQTLSRQSIGETGGELTDWLVQIQRAVAEQVCQCNTVAEDDTDTNDVSETSELE